MLEQRALKLLITGMLMSSNSSIDYKVTLYEMEVQLKLND